MNGSCEARLSRFERARQRSSLRAHAEQHAAQQKKAHAEQQQHHIRAFQHDHGFLFKTAGCDNVDLSEISSGAVSGGSCMLSVVDPMECVSAEIG